MSPDVIENPSQLERDYLQVWAGAATKVLEQLHGSTVTATPVPEASGAPAETAADAVWTAWKLSGKLSGEQTIFISPSDAVRLTQMLMQETPDGSAPMDDMRADALKEVFRQFAGIAASACKSKYGQEVTIELTESAKPAWAPAFQGAWAFASAQLPPLQWTIGLSAELLASLKAAAAAKPGPPAAPAPPPTVAQTAAKAVAAGAASPKPAPAAMPPAVPAGDGDSLGSATNLDMLLDVELEAILRFGQREMLLRDILELRPGSVIELNRNISEPAELLVGGRVIARGDVVIVDGNYGLRITEIEHPRQRLTAIET